MGFLLNPYRYAGITAASLDFHALTYDESTYEMLGVKTGTGDLTTTHTSTLYVSDYNDIWRTVAANEPVWNGARIVRNLLQNSEDFTDATWTKTNVTVTTGISDPNSGTTAVTITGLSGGNRRIYTNINKVNVGDTNFFSVWIRRRTGTGTVQLYPGSASSQIVNITSQLTSSWQRFYGPAAMMASISSNNWFGVRMLTTGDEVDVWHPQVEPLTTTGFTTNRVVNGTFDTDTDWTVPDGCTIIGGVASWDGTQTGSSVLISTNYLEEIIPTLGYIKRITVTNYVAGSILMRAGTGDESTSISANGVYEFLEHSGGSGYRLVASSDWQADIDDVEYLRQEVLETVPSEYVATTGTESLKAFGNQNGNTVLDNVVIEDIGLPFDVMPRLRYLPVATNDCLESRDLTTTWAQQGTVTRTYDQIGLEGIPNTATLVDEQDATARRYTHQTITVPIDSNVNTVRVFIKKDNDETRFPVVYCANATTESFRLNTKTGAYNNAHGTPNVEIVDAGDWWACLLESTNDGADNTSSIRIFPAYCTTWTGQESAAVGSIIVSNVEMHLNKEIKHVRGLPPIFTTTAAVNTDKTVYTFDIANHEPYNSMWFFKLAPSTDIITDGDPLGWADMYTNGGSGNDRYYTYNNGITLRTSGDPDASHTNSTTVMLIDVEDKYGLVYSVNDSLKIVNCRGAYGSSASFTALVSSVEIKIFKNNQPYACDMADIQRWGIPTLQTGKDILDELMSPPLFNNINVIPTVVVGDT